MLQTSPCVLAPFTDKKNLKQRTFSNTIQVTTSHELSKSEKKLIRLHKASMTIFNLRSRLQSRRRKEEEGWLRHCIWKGQVTLYGVWTS